MRQRQPCPEVSLSDMFIDHGEWPFIERVAPLVEGRDNTTMHQQKLTIRLATTAVIAALVLAFGIVWTGTGLASVGNSDDGSAAMAQNGNGNGNGNQGQGNGNGQGATENPGQGAGAENQGNGQGNGNRGQGNGNGQGAENQGNGQGNGNQGQGQGVEVQTQDAVETEEVTEDATDEAAPAAAEAEKVNVCHTTGNEGGVFITVSQNAVPAHEGHGDDMDVTSEAECEVAQAPEGGDVAQAPQSGEAATPGVGDDEDAAEAPEAPGATPTVGDDDGDEDATPEAGEASPEASPVGGV